jgi:hypothetical protein
MSDKLVALRWRKSKASMLSECVEVASNEDRVLIRDTADRSGPVLRFSDREWRSFVDRIAAALYLGLGRAPEAAGQFA